MIIKTFKYIYTCNVNSNLSQQSKLHFTDFLNNKDVHAKYTNVMLQTRVF